MKIHVAQAERRLGPFTLEEVKGHLAIGDVTLTDLAWYDGIPEWIPLRDVPGIIKPAITPPPYEEANSEDSGTWAQWVLVIGIALMLGAVAVPNFLRARKRSSATTIKSDLRLIDAAVDQYALDYNLKPEDKVTWDQVKLYLKPLANLYITEPATLETPNPNHLDWAPDPFIDLAPFTVDSALPTPAGTSALFGDTIAQEFWSPFPFQ